MFNLPIIQKVTFFSDWPTATDTSDWKFQSKSLIYGYFGLESPNQNRHIHHNNGYYVKSYFVIGIIYLKLVHYLQRERPTWSSLLFLKAISGLDAEHCVCVLAKAALWSSLAVCSVSLSGWICLCCWRTRTRSGNGAEPVRRASVSVSEPRVMKSVCRLTYFGFAFNWNAIVSGFVRLRVERFEWIFNCRLILDFLTKTNGFLAQ